MNHSNYIKIESWTYKIRRIGNNIVKYLELRNRQQGKYHFCSQTKQSPNLLLLKSSHLWSSVKETEEKLLSANFIAEIIKGCRRLEKVHIENMTIDPETYNELCSLPYAKDILVKLNLHFG